MTYHHYDVPTGKVRRRFVVALVEELCRVQDRLWNSERFVVFQTLILQRARHVPASQSIRRRTKKILDTWEAGRHRMLIEETLRTCVQ